jgi:hypothetical protein
MGTVAWISQPPKTLGQYIRGGANFVIGIGLCLLSLLKLTDTVAEYTSSPWVLPTLCLSLFIGKFLYLVLFNFSKKYSSETNDKLCAVVVINHLGSTSKREKVH